VADFGWAVLAKRNGYYVKAVWPILNLMDGKKITCRMAHSVHLGFVNHRLGRREILVQAGLDLDENNRMVVIDHNQVDFAGVAGVVARKCLKPFSFEEFFALPLPPFSQQLYVF
jgi:hypothetical protein